jgi:microcystin-dependent protein
MPHTSLMKSNQHHTSRATTRLLLIIALAFGAGSLHNLFAQGVPERMNYQGLLLTGAGTPVTAPTDVEFRIWDSPTNTVGLKWGRSFRITPDANGVFNIVLSGEGTLLSGAPNVSLTNVFTATNTEARYLELTVSNSTAIRPRQQFLASPYAFLANDVTAARQNFTVAGALTVAGAASAASFVGSGAGLTNISTNSLVQAVVDALCPPGAIVAFGGADIPSGWKLCDGSILTTNQYYRLWLAIGYNWGKSGTYDFRLPDLRGHFLRGRDGGAARDPDRTVRTALYTGGATGDAVGSVQTDGFKSHTHTWMFGLQGDDSGSGSSYQEYTRIPGTSTDSIAYTGGNETRPVNAYVNYIIKH